MATATETMQKRNLSQPEETRTFEKGKVEVVNVGDSTLGRATLEPGWKWSTCVKPIAKTESCQVQHLQYQIAGRLHVRMQDGSEEEFGPGDVAFIPPGHDAWVVGNEAVVLVDVHGLKEYAKA